MGESEAVKIAAFEGSNRIVIDEAEAAADIRNIEDAARKLAEARALLAPDRINDSCMMGKTRGALNEKLGGIGTALKKFESWCAQECGMINMVVRKYQRIDRELAGRVQGNADGDDDN
ncbi:MAG: hypothetical protein LBS75_06955 [Synergistaceae bacterium]|jgi:hypothetical protein|nr:hypothetical protein [Synergistaceae bacterium]